MPRIVLPAYGFDEESTRVAAFGTGLINHTWKVENAGGQFILQRVNHSIFREPEIIANNISLIGGYLRAHHPDYLFVSPVKTIDGKELVNLGPDGYYRMFPFVNGSHSKDVVETPAQAFEAAAQFGRFTRLLSGIDLGLLKVSIPFFHDLGLRYEQFIAAIEKGDPERRKSAAALIDRLSAHVDIVSTYLELKSNPAFRLRVTHHDTKISNVLFDDHGNGLCVIDLDTVMPGYFISDVGDMMRTYLSPVSEEEGDFDKIVIREEFYKAIVEGYYREMQGELTPEECNYFFYAGTFMIYMQALRFATDYLNNDIYYGAGYPGHNFVRASNQAVLLEKLIEKKPLLAQLVTIV